VRPCPVDRLTSSSRSSTYTEIVRRETLPRRQRRAIPSPHGGAVCRARAVACLAAGCARSREISPASPHCCSVPGCGAATAAASPTVQQETILHQLANLLPIPPGACWISPHGHDRVRSCAGRERCRRASWRSLVEGDADGSGAHNSSGYNSRQGQTMEVNPSEQAELNAAAGLQLTRRSKTISSARRCIRGKL